MGLDISVLKACTYEEADLDSSGKPKYMTLTELSQDLKDSLKKTLGSLIQDIPDAGFDWGASGYPEFEDPGFWETHHLDWDTASDNEEDWFAIITSYPDGSEVQVKEKDISYKPEPGFYYQEVGSQRKGASDQFYKDGLWDDLDKTFVVSRDTLIQHWHKYFSGNHGRLNDYDMTDYECSVEFEKNIVNKFIDGKTIVRYW